VFEGDIPYHFSSNYIILIFISSLSSSFHTCPDRALPYVAIVRVLISLKLLGIITLYVWRVFSKRHFEWPVYSTVWRIIDL